ncbi:MAG: hypothetical protein N2A99_06400 [Carnobacterium alterfunditum]
MQTILSTILIIPLIVWASFSPMLMHNASMTKETIKLALYEVSKEAALQGKFDESLYLDFKESLVENHNYNPDCIQISGTESEVTRGEAITVTVTIPKPMMSVFDAMTISSCDRPDSYTPYEITHSINSEYLP